jgi:predicted porin
VGSTTENIIGANYDFGIAKIFVGQSTATGSKSAVGYGVNVPFGALTFGFGMSSQGTTDNTQFGVTYGLSKRTSVYAAQGQKTGTPNVSLLGVRHNF